MKGEHIAARRVQVVQVAMNRQRATPLLSFITYRLHFYVEMFFEDSISLRLNFQSFSKSGEYFVELFNFHLLKRTGLILRTL